MRTHTTRTHYAPHAHTRTADENVHVKFALSSTAQAGTNSRANVQHIADKTAGEEGEEDHAPRMSGKLEMDMRISDPLRLDAWTSGALRSCWNVLFLQEGRREREHSPKLKPKANPASQKEKFSDDLMSAYPC
jgi:hypothetical protein